MEEQIVVDIFETLTEESALAAVACNHNHALVQNPFAWDESDEEEVED